MRRLGCGTYGMWPPHLLVPHPLSLILCAPRSQTRAPIQVLEEARDAVQALHVDAATIVAGSVDGYVRTYDLRKGELRADFVGRTFPRLIRVACSHPFFFTEPVTSVVPSADGTTLLVATLDSHVRLFDAATGKLLNAFTGHAHTSYRCRACFGHEEASVVCGDEDGRVWAWDLVDVGGDGVLLLSRITDIMHRRRFCSQTLHPRFTTR